MKRRSIIKAIFYTLGAIAAVISIAVWIFLSFYFEKTLNKVVIPKIELAAFKATQGRFTLTLDKIYYKNGTLVCHTFILSRAGYDSSEHGMVLDRLTLDSARFEGISWWDVLWGNDLNLVSLQLNAPKLYMANLDSEFALSHNTHYDTSGKSGSAVSKVPVISFDSIVLRDISVFLPKPSGKSIEPAYRNITLKLTNFSLDTKHTAGEPALFSKHVNFELPRGSYSLGDSTYSIEVRGIHGSLSDSLVTIDSFGYIPNYGEQAFANKFKYSQSRLDFRCAGIKIRGIDFAKILNGGGLHVRALEAASWYFDYYDDKRKPLDPHPADAVLPNAIINSIKAAVTVDSIIFMNGRIQHRERVLGSTYASLLYFTNANVIASPFCTDTSNVLFREPLHISVTTLFMGQAKMIASITYPVHKNQFDLHIDASVGTLHLPVLNSYLVSNERKQIMSGECLGGVIHMDVRSGTGVTTVTPRYTDLKLNVLATDVKKSRGILEGITTFIANTFVLRTNNIDDGDKKAFGATVTTHLTRKEEFFEFVWISIRTSILKVLGY